MSQMTRPEEGERGLGASHRRGGMGEASYRRPPEGLVKALDRVESPTSKAPGVKRKVESMRDKRAKRTASGKLHIDDGCMGGGEAINTYDDETDNNEWNGDAGSKGSAPSTTGSHIYGDYFTDSRQRVFWHFAFVKNYKSAAGEQQYDSLILDYAAKYGSEDVAKGFMHELGHGINAWRGGPPQDSDGNGDVDWHNPDPDESVMYYIARKANVIDYSDAEWNNLLLNRIANPV